MYLFIYWGGISTKTRWEDVQVRSIIVTTVEQYLTTSFPETATAKVNNEMFAKTTENMNMSPCLHHCNTDLPVSRANIATCCDHPVLFFCKTFENLTEQNTLKHLDRNPLYVTGMYYFGIIVVLFACSSESDSSRALECQWRTNEPISHKVSETLAHEPHASWNVSRSLSTPLGIIFPHF